MDGSIINSHQILDDEPALPPKTDRLHLFRVITNITERFFFLLFISTWFSGQCLVQPNSLPARNNEMSISLFSFVSLLLRRIIRLFQFQMSSIKQLKDPPNRWAGTTLETRRLYYLLVWYSRWGGRNVHIHPSVNFTATPVVAVCPPLL